VNLSQTGALEGRRTLQAAGYDQHGNHAGDQARGFNATAGHESFQRRGRGRAWRVRGVDRRRRQ